MSDTMKFSREINEEYKVKEILRNVHDSLEAKGYAPINQMVGYLISGDPTYITSKNNARQLIAQLDRDEIIEILLKTFLYEE